MSAALLAAKVALAPVLLPQARRVRRTAVRLPEADGPRVGVVGEGVPRLRILVVGDSSAAGVGVQRQAQALALPLATEIGVRRNATVGWQLVAKTGVDSSTAHGLLAEASLLPTDVAVFVLGVNDVTSQTPPSRFVANLESLWQEVRGRTGATWAVFNGLPPMHRFSALPQPLRWYLGRCAESLDGELREWTRAQGHAYCELRWSEDPAGLAEDGFHPGASMYPQWTKRLAEHIVERPLRWT